MAWGRVRAQVLLQATVWREAKVQAHIHNRHTLLTELRSEPAGNPEAVFCWETVLKVRLRCCWVLQGGVPRAHPRGGVLMQECWLL